MLKRKASLRFTKGFLIVLLGLITLADKSMAQRLETVDKIVAKVDDYYVLKSEVELGYISYMSSARPQPGFRKCDMLQQLVINKLLLAKAKIDSVVVSPIELESNMDQRFQYMVAQIGSEKQIEEYYNKTIAEFKAELRDDIEEQLIAQRMSETITGDVDVTPKEIKKFFNQIPSDSLPYLSREVEIAQIVKEPTIGKEEKAKAKKKLADLKARILAGEDFEELAKEYSEGPSRTQGGNLGFAGRGQMDPKYEAGALALKPMEISDPIESSFGFHLIQLLDRRGNNYNSRHIILTPSSNAQDFDLATEYLDSLRNLILTDTIFTFDKVAKEYSDDELTGGNGGFFESQVGSTMMSVDEMDPSLFFLIDTMSVGTVSKPIRFRQPDGKEAMRVIYYKDQVPPHQANLKEDYEKFKIFAANKKKAEVQDKWFVGAIKEVFIEIDPEYESCKILQMDL